MATGLYLVRGGGGGERDLGLWWRGLSEGGHWHGLCKIHVVHSKTTLEGRKEGRMDGRKDRRAEGRKDKRTEGRKDKRTEGLKDRRTEGQKDGRIKG